MPFRQKRSTIFHNSSVIICFTILKARWHYPAKYSRGFVRHIKPLEALGRLLQKWGQRTRIRPQYIGCSNSRKLKARRLKKRGNPEDDFAKSPYLEKSPSRISGSDQSDSMSSRYCHQWNSQG